MPLKSSAFFLHTVFTWYILTLNITTGHFFDCCPELLNCHDRDGHNAARAIYM